MFPSDSYKIGIILFTFSTKILKPTIIYDEIMVKFNECINLVRTGFTDCAKLASFKF